MRSAINRLKGLMTSTIESSMIIFLLERKRGRTKSVGFRESSALSSEAMVHAEKLRYDHGKEHQANKLKK